MSSTRFTFNIRSDKMHAFLAAQYVSSCLTVSEFQLGLGRTYVTSLFGNFTKLKCN